MRLVYLDEAGSSKHEAQELIITVAAIVVHGDLQTLPIEQDAQKIIDTLVPEQFRANFEFHAKDLFSGDAYPGWPAWGATGKHAVLAEFMKLIPKHNLPVLEASVHKVGFWKMFGKQEEVAEPYLAHKVTFQFCAISVEGWFRKNAAHERGLCIADDTKARPALKRGLKRYRAGVQWTFGENDDPQIVRLDHLIDTVYFGNSNESVMLQLADVCAFFIKRTVMQKQNAERFYDIIKPQIPGTPSLFFKSVH